MNIGNIHHCGEIKTVNIHHRREINTVLYTPYSKQTEVGISRIYPSLECIIMYMENIRHQTNLSLRPRFVLDVYFHTRSSSGYILYIYSTKGGQACLRLWVHME